MADKFMNKIYKNKNATLLFRIIFAFTMGLIFGPFADGIFFLILISLISELLCYIFTGGDPEYFNIVYKPIIILCYLIGWIIGRFLSIPNENIIHHGIPCLDSLNIFC